MSNLLRKGRLSSARRDVVKFTSSALIDKKILKHIIEINKAHVLMLVECNILSKDYGCKILKALSNLHGSIKLFSNMEDGHMVVEEKIIEAIGQDIGGNLNLAKSRNDQVATAIRMELREEIIRLIETLVDLQEKMLHLANKHLFTIVPGYTHLQPAQPITFAHYIVAQFDALQRTILRLQETFDNVNLCPMGACALATTSFPINRERVSELLGFNEVLENSVDAVTTRDFLLEVMAELTILAVDVTRFVEDLEIWSTMEFGIVELPDGFASTSSIMPQKKNPDILEVIRARISLVLGNYTGSATVLMSLPSTYNMDFQEITPKLWQSIDTVDDCLSMLAKIVSNLIIKSIALDKHSLSFLSATELANLLVRNYEIPFRTSHRIVGIIVKRLLEDGKSFRDLTVELVSEVAKQVLGHDIPLTAKEISNIMDLSRIVESYNVKGGPAPEEVKRMMKARFETISRTETWISEKKNKLSMAHRRLGNCITEILSSC